MVKALNLYWGSHAFHPTKVARFIDGRKQKSIANRYQIHLYIFIQVYFSMPHGHKLISIKDRYNHAISTVS